MNGRPDAAAMLARRTQEIEAEYWSVRDGGKPEKSAMAQIAYTLALTEQGSAIKDSEIASLGRQLEDSKRWASEMVATVQPDARGRLRGGQY
jgi:hypothetical protein